MTDFPKEPSSPGQPSAGQHDADSQREHRVTQGFDPAATLPAQLSAFIDDELPANENDLFVRRLVRDAELKQCMNRYLLIGEALRNPPNRQTSPGVSRDFSQRVAQAVQIDAAPAVVPRPAPEVASRKWLKNVVGLAVAASVAVVTVAVMRHQIPQSQGEQGSVASTMAASTATTERHSYVVPSSANAPAAPLPTARLTNYVVAHSEFSSPLGRRNLMTGLLSEEDQTPNDKAPAAATADAASAPVDISKP